MSVVTNVDSLRSRLNYEPQVLGFGTSGRRGKVVDLTQLEIYLNALAELEYLQSLPLTEGGIRRGEDFYFAYDLRPSSSEFVTLEEGRGQIAQAIVQAITDAGMQAVNLGRIPTPALASFALSRNKGSIMVTGSHIPFERNGYKTYSSRGELLKEQEAPINEQVRQVRRRLYEQPWDQSLFDQRGMLRCGHQELPAEQGAARAAYIERFTNFFCGLQPQRQTHPRLPTFGSGTGFAGGDSGASRCGSGEMRTQRYLCSHRHGEYRCATAGGDSRTGRCRRAGRSTPWSPPTAIAIARWF